MESFIEKLSNVINAVEMDKVTFVVGAVFVVICTCVSMSYSSLCENEYGIPRLYFVTDFKYKVLEVVINIMAVSAFALFWPLIENLEISAIVKYSFRFSVIGLIMLLLYDLLSRASINRIRNAGWHMLLISISAAIFATNSSNELSIVLSMIMVLLIVWILYKSFKVETPIKYYVKCIVLFIVLCILKLVITVFNIPINLVKAVVVLLYFVIFYVLLFMMCLGKFDIIKIFKDFKHQRQYETVRVKNKEYVVLSHYNDMIVCVKYEFVKENSQLILHTNFYELIKEDAGKVQYKDFSKGLGYKYEVKIIKE